MLEMIVTAVVSGGLATLLVGILGRAWFEARIKASIEHEYKKQFELFQRKQEQHEKIALVADLLAEYLRTPYGEPVPRDQRFALNRLSLQASLWLPAELALELSNRLQNKSEAKTVFEVILLARSSLTGDTSLTVNNVTLWGSDKEKKGDPVLHTPSG